MVQHHNLVENSGVTEVHAGLQKTYYRPQIVADITSAFRDCVHCAKNWVFLSCRHNTLKLFPAIGPLKFMAIDTLKTLPESQHRERKLVHKPGQVIQ